VILNMISVFHLAFTVLKDHMLVSVCLLGCNLNVNAKSKKLGPSRDTTGI